MSLSIANHAASLPVAFRLYLPKEWAEDEGRRLKAHVPSDVTFRTKGEIALDQIRAALDAGLPRGVVLMDAGYGVSTLLREQITALSLPYIAGISPNTSLWAPGSSPLRPKQWSGNGRPPKLLRRDDEHRPVSAKALAQALPAKAFRTITWSEGTSGKLSSRFARVRVRAAHRDNELAELRAEEWLLIEWPKGEKEPTKYRLSTLPQDTLFKRLVDLAKLRWRIERDYRELKQELGLSHFEGRSWRGFHHHASLSIAAYGFLISSQQTIPPSAPRKARLLQGPPVPENYRPRGAARAA